MRCTNGCLWSAWNEELVLHHILRCETSTRSILTACLSKGKINVELSLGHNAALSFGFSSANKTVAIPELSMSIRYRFPHWWCACRAFIYGERLNALAACYCIPVNLSGQSKTRGGLDERAMMNPYGTMRSPFAHCRAFGVDRRRNTSYSEHLMDRFTRRLWLNVTYRFCDTF